jgi:HAD superfamily hydrolase (TIGR01490 family)
MGHTFLRETDKSRKYIAFFDLDRTIITINSGRTLVRYAYEQGLMPVNDLIKGIYLSLLYRLNLMDASRIVDSMVTWAKGVPEAMLKKVSDDMFKASLINSINTRVVSEITAHKNNGGCVVILSSSIRPVCQIVAHHLGIDDVICSDLEVMDGIYTGYPEGKLCFGEEKTVRLNEYCRQKNSSPSDAWYYGDSFSDFHVLSAVGNPVCVHPDKKLKKAARARGWKILT